jgi:alkylation response protein AidB-like acyl-CoA dehydrogenase
VWVPDARVLGERDADATPALSAMLAEATVGMALDMIGACGALFDSSLDAGFDAAEDAPTGNGPEAQALPATDGNGTSAGAAGDKANGRSADQAPVSPPARAPAQATKHALVEMLTTLERARAIVYHATCAVAERQERAAVLASEAKASAGACQRLVTARSVEVHGAGAGRAEAQLWIRRAQAGELLLGASADHRRVVADDLFRVSKGAAKGHARGKGLAAVLGL